MTIEAEIQDIKEMLDDIPDDFAKYSTIIEMGDELEPYPEEFKLDELKVPGCQSDLWLVAERKDDVLHYRATSDAVIDKGKDFGRSIKSGKKKDRKISFTTPGLTRSGKI